MARSTLSEMTERYLSALNRGDLPEAAELAVLISDSDPGVVELIDDFVNLIDLHPERAGILLSKIADRYEEMSASEAESVERATAVLEAKGNTEEKITEALNLPEQASTIELQRSRFLLLAIRFLETGEGDVNDVKQVARETIDLEQQFAQEQEKAGSIVETTELPPRLTVQPTDVPEEVVVGERKAVTFRMKNVGDAVAENASLTIDADEEVSVTPASTAVGPVEPGESVRTEIDLTVSEEGQHSVVVEAAWGDDEDSVEDVTVTARTEALSIREAITGGPNRVPNAAEIQQATVFWSDDTPVPGTGGETINTDTLQQLIEAWLEARS